MPLETSVFPFTARTVSSFELLHYVRDWSYLVHNIIVFIILFWQVQALCMVFQIVKVIASLMIGQCFHVTVWYILRLQMEETASIYGR
jgi:hypothetical protein